jgi:hypothetical protein
MITGSFLIFDHRLRSLKIVVNAFLEDGSVEQVYAAATESIDAIRRKFAQPAELLLPETRPAPTPRSNFGRAEFERALNRQRNTSARAISFRSSCRNGLSAI